MLKENHQTKLPDWIKDYRDQSWQIEMLIAGGTVFTLFNVTDMVRDFFFQTYPILEYSLYRTLLLFGIYLVTRILLIGFTANLTLRAVWLAYLGINFSFPDGINYSKLKASNTSKDILREQPNILDRVVTLEKLCNLSYSWAVLMAIFGTSIFISLIAIIFLLDVLNVGDIIYSATFVYLLAFFIGFVQMGLLDRLLFTGKPSGRKISKLKHLLSTMLSYLTLSFLFQREVLTLRTNIHRAVLYCMTIGLIGVSLLISAVQIGQYWQYGTIDLQTFDDRTQYRKAGSPILANAAYENQHTDGMIFLRAGIQSDIVKEDYLRLFVVSWVDFDRFLKTSFEEYGYPSTDKNKISKVNIDDKPNTDSLFYLTMNDMLHISIDDEPKRPLKWKRYKHPKSKEEGYITYIPIDTLSNSEHLLSVDVNYTSWNDSTTIANWIDIPFWKE